MPRLPVPIITDFTTRKHTTTNVLTNATYMQNVFIKQDNKPKIYNRPALKENTTQGNTIQFLAGADSPVSGGILLVGLNASTLDIGIYAQASATGALTLKSTPWTAASHPGAVASSAQLLPLTNYALATPYPAYILFITGFIPALQTWAYLVDAAGNVSNISPTFSPSYIGIAQLDGYAFGVGSATIGGLTTVPVIYNSAVYNPTSYNVLDYIVPDVRGGTAIGVESYKNHIVFFGTRNVQLFYDAGEPSPGSPLLPRYELVYNFGAVQTKAVIQDTPSAPWWKSKTGDVLTFIGQTYDNKKFIGLFNEFQMEKISNTFIDGLLDTTNEIYISGYTYYGKTFIHLTIGSTFSAYYDIETKLWHIFQSSIPDFVSNPKFQASIWNSHSQQTIMLTFCNGPYDTANAYAGREYYFDDPANAHQDTDKSSATYSINAVIQTPRFRGEPGIESQRKFMTELQLIGDTLASADTVSLQFSDDDYQTFSSARTVDMTKSLKQLTRLGYFRERVIKLTYSGTQQIRLENLEAQLQVGTN